jgi:hypothetical protein
MAVGGPAQAQDAARTTAPSGEGVITGADIPDLVRRLRQEEALSPAQSRYADQLMRKQHLTPTQLADFLEAVHAKALTVEYEQRVRRAASPEAEPLGPRPDAARVSPIGRSVLLLLIGGGLVLVVEHVLGRVLRWLLWQRRLRQPVRQVEYSDKN